MPCSSCGGGKRRPSESEEYVYVVSTLAGSQVTYRNETDAKQEVRRNGGTYRRKLRKK